jgi:hypothetical protein
MAVRETVPAELSRIARALSRSVVKSRAFVLRRRRRHRMAFEELERLPDVAHEQAGQIAARPVPHERELQHEISMLELPSSITCVAVGMFSSWRCAMQQPSPHLRFAGQPSKSAAPRDIARGWRQIANCRLARAASRWRG